MIYDLYVLYNQDFTDKLRTQEWEQSKDLRSYTVISIEQYVLNLMFIQEILIQPKDNILICIYVLVLSLIQPLTACTYMSSSEVPLK